MNSPYPPGCDNRASNADPASPHFLGHICVGCGQSEYDGCKCEALAAWAELEEAQENLEMWNASDEAQQLETAYADHEKLKARIALVAEWMEEAEEDNPRADAQDWLEFRCVQNRFTARLKLADEMIDIFEDELNELHQAFTAAKAAVKNLEA